MLTAINKKYASLVNRVYINVRKYQELVNLEDTCETEKERNKNITKQDKAFNKYSELLEDLPKREIDNLQKQHKNIHGYNF